MRKYLSDVMNQTKQLNDGRENTALTASLVVIGSLFGFGFMLGRKTKR